MGVALGERKEGGVCRLGYSQRGQRESMKARNYSKYYERMTQGTGSRVSFPRAFSIPCSLLHAPRPPPGAIKFCSRERFPLFQKRDGLFVLSMTQANGRARARASFLLLSLSLSRYVCRFNAFKRIILQWAEIGAEKRSLLDQKQGVNAACAGPRM